MTLRNEEDKREAQYSYTTTRMEYGILVVDRYINLHLMYIINVETSHIYLVKA